MRNLSRNRSARPAHPADGPRVLRRVARDGTRVAYAAAALGLLTTAACSSGDHTGSDASASPTLSSTTGSLGDTGSAAQGSANPVQPPAPAGGQVEVVRELPHDPKAFTQGLELHDGTLYESTGMYGTSWVTTRPLEGPADQYTQRADLPPEQFGEGLAVTGDGTLWQLTWKDGIAYKRDAATLAETGTAKYDGEGWGLCAQPVPGGERLVMSDGSENLTFRDPSTFDEQGRVAVTENGSPVRELNELECVGNDVYANIWQQNRIVRIDPATGSVTGSWDLSGLQQPRPTNPNAVLNGIAAVPGSDTFLVTGKLWPTMYEVRLK